MYSLVDGRSDVFTHAVRLDHFQLSDAGDKGQSRLDLCQCGNLEDVGLALLEITRVYYNITKFPGTTIISQ